MFCRQCGTKLDDSDRFCPNCGASVSGAAPAPQKTKAKPAGQQLLAWRNRNAVYAQICISAITILILICFVFLPILKWDPNGIESEEELNYLPERTAAELMIEHQVSGGPVSRRSYSVFMNLMQIIPTLVRDPDSFLVLFVSIIFTVIICYSSVSWIIIQTATLIASFGQLKKLNDNSLLPQKEKNGKTILMNIYPYMLPYSYSLFLFCNLTITKSFTKEWTEGVVWYDKYFSGVSGWISVIIILWIVCIAASLYKECLTNKTQAQILRDKEAA